MKIATFATLNQEYRIMKKSIKTISTLMLAIALVCTAGCKKQNAGNGNYNGHDYVDLGLPSGTLWATCNVGATTPEGYGDYFAWGETTPKNTYYSDNYKHADILYDNIFLTKYCNDSGHGYNGFTDNLTVLEPGDDAASANWGDGWCMPSVDQWRELMDGTLAVWTTQNGVEGRLFTALNGNTLFLPAAGVRENFNLYNAGNAGRYWSSSLATDYSTWFARIFSFHSDNYNIGKVNRVHGMSVRAVHSKCKN